MTRHILCSCRTILVLWLWLVSLRLVLWMREALPKVEPKTFNLRVALRPQLRPSQFCSWVTQEELKLWSKLQHLDLDHPPCLSSKAMGCIAGGEEPNSLHNMLPVCYPAGASRKTCLFLLIVAIDGVGVHSCWWAQQCFWYPQGFGMQHLASQCSARIEERCHFWTEARTMFELPMSS